MPGFFEAQINPNDVTPITYCSHGKVALGFKNNGPPESPLKS